MEEFEKNLMNFTNMPNKMILEQIDYDKHFYNDNYGKIERLNHCLEKLGTNDVMEINFMNVYSLYFYYPTEIMVYGRDEMVRKQILCFKNDGGFTMNEYKESVHRFLTELKYVLKNTFREMLPELTLFCIPSSTQRGYKARCEAFSNQLCSALGMMNGYGHLSYLLDGISKSKNHGEGRDCQVILDKRFWKGRFVILFDDLVTQGLTMMKYQEMLQACGAYTVCGLTLGTTVHKARMYHPIDNYNMLYMKK